MKYSFAILAIIGVAAAQGLDQFPSCGLTCLTGAMQGSACAATDFKCTCSDQAFIAKASECIMSSCQPDDQKKALAAAKTLCASAGVDISPSHSSAESTAKHTAKPTASAEPVYPSGVPSVKPTAQSSEVPATTLVPSSSAPASNATASLTHPIATQAPGNSAGRASAALGLVGLGMLAAIAL
ncbi:hypothetical protein K440DRAFT_659410 [Wilcoxina mikolae CBS 423.85]|nr:hypothetical protein K440DRAFT_659410 [Wilcoxina mikolae CBS 423.85]